MYKLEIRIAVLAQAPTCISLKLHVSDFDAYETSSKVYVGSDFITAVSEFYTVYDSLYI
jgi:hypothetical protein